MNIIETTRLSKRYRKQVAVDAISFTVETGQVFGFLGPNGSGKTTTIGMLLGIITPTGGGFRLFGREGTRELHAVRRRIGATLETPNFYPYLSGRDNLRIAANIKGVGADAIARALDVVGLTARQKDRFRTYSLGMKQRLAIAATLLADPDLVILDEPANGLDPEGMREVREIIGALAAQGKTVFVSSHLLHEVELTCTHVAIIKKGRLIHQASVTEIVTGDAIAELRGADPAALVRAVAEYPGAVSAAAQGDVVVTRLTDDDLGELNRFLAGRGVYVSHLALRQRSLEDVFMELTGEGVPDESEPELAGVA